MDTADAMLYDLAEGVAHTVQWYEAARLMGELGVTPAVEVLPGHVLTRLLPSAAPGVAAHAMADGDVRLSRPRAAPRRG